MDRKLNAVPDEVDFDGSYYSSRVFCLEKGLSDVAALIGSEDQFKEGFIEEGCDLTNPMTTL